jgi:hypothetical protein
MILSIFHSRASAVISVVKKSSAGVFDSVFLEFFVFASNGISASSSGFADWRPEKIFSARFQKSFSIFASVLASSDFCGFIPSFVPILWRSVIFASKSLGLIQIYSK